MKPELARLKQRSHEALLQARADRRRLGWPQACRRTQRLVCSWDTGTATDAERTPGDP
jgi:hypothetical protein